MSCVSAVRQISSPGIILSVREDRDAETTEGEVTERTVERVTWTWRRIIRKLIDREDASPEISFVMMLVCWMMWRQCCLSTTASERGTIDFQFTQSASGTPPGRSSDGEFSWRRGLGPLTAVNANAWIVLTPSWQWPICEEIFRLLKVAVPPIGESETSEIDSVEFSRDWTLNELSELTREKRNLTLCARASMGLIYDRDPTMMCVLSGRLFNVPPITLGGLVKRRIARKLPMWRPAPSNSPTPSRDLTTHVDASLERRAPRQRTSRVRSDRMISVSDHFWVRMETDRIDRLKFGSVVALPDDVLVSGTRALSPAKCRLCRRSKDIFEWSDNVSEQCRGRYVIFFWRSPECLWWVLSCESRRKWRQDQPVWSLYHSRSDWCTWTHISKNTVIWADW